MIGKKMDTISNVLSVFFDPVIWIGVAIIGTIITVITKPVKRK